MFVRLTYKILFRNVIHNGNNETFGAAVGRQIPRNRHLGHNNNFLERFPLHIVVLSIEYNRQFHLFLTNSGYILQI